MSTQMDNSTQKPRMFFIDNLRILLTILVISHHISIIMVHRATLNTLKVSRIC